MKNNYKTLARKFFLLLAAFFLCFFAQVKTLEAQSSKGTEFWIGFPGNIDSQGQRQLYITAEANAEVNINIANPAYSNTVNVASGSLTTINLPNQVDIQSSGLVENKGIHITSDVPVTVYVMNQQTATTDAYLALPLDAIGTEYYVMAYTRDASFSSLNSQMTIVATEDNTSVTITPRASGGGFTAGVSGNIVLNKGQTFQLRSNSTNADYTGSYVVADKPISVFGGNDCTNISGSLRACDHLVQQMVPVTGWGQSFLTVPLATRIAGDVFRIMAQQSGTQVNINGVNVANLAAGQFYETILGSATYNRITSNNPILVGQYSRSSDADGVTSDPFFALVPPDEQFLNSYVVSAGTPNIPTNFLNITSPTSNTGTVQVNGVTVSASAWTVIPGTTFSGARVSVPNGIHTVTSTLPIGLLVYGFGSFDSYGYLGGQAFAAIATINSITISPTTGTALAGTNQCWEAEVLDQFGDPVSGVRVDFDIIGPNNSKSGFAFTDANGKATFCYTGEEAGDDEIVARVGSLSASATFTWQELTRAASVSISPKTGSGFLNTYQCWDALVLDQFGDPIAGQEVGFDVSGPNSGVNGTVMTNASGIATFCFSGAALGTDQISASVGLLSDFAEFTWLPVIVVEGDAYCTLSQGFFGTPVGSDCEGRSTEEVINLSLDALGGITVGSTFPFVLIAEPGQAKSIILRLPSTGPSVAITAGPNFVSGPTVLPGIYTWDRGRNAGQMRNTLIGQALTLSLNLGLSPNLAMLEIPAGYDFLVTAKADGCYDAEASAIPGTEQFYPIPQSVTSYLNGGNGYSASVQGLLDLANDAISGLSLSGEAPDLGEITAALEAIIEAFLHCRVLIGWEIMVEIEQLSAELGQESIEMESVNAFNMFPNPASSQATFTFTLSEQQRVSVEIFNINGVRVETLFEGDLQGNQQHSIKLNARDLAPGLYFYRFVAGSVSKTGSLMITR
jgi:hypothetical protein